MRIIRFLFVAILTLAVTVVLNVRINNSIPPLGAFFDPFGGFWQNAYNEEDRLTATIEADGLTNQVEIYYDENLIPYIYAANEKDLYFAQGYVTASHRLWQMELQTRLAAGRLSEVFGGSLLEIDRLNRRKGLPYGAKNALKALQQDSSLMALVKSYSDGVNAYIASLGKGQLPLEYKLLNYKPEPWSPYKSMLLSKYMADLLSGNEADLENTNALKMVGQDTFNLLFPGRNTGEVPVVPASHEWDFEPLSIPEGDPDYVSHFISQVYEKPDPYYGSNNWAIGAALSATGNAILANDMHLPLNLPSIFFFNQLSCPESTAFGVSIPGAMGIIAGFNDSISWGMTNAKRDVIDWYKITFRDEEKQEYKYGNQWLKTQTFVESIAIRSEEPFYDTITYTHYGPVVYDENYKAQSNMESYAMKWIAHQPTLEQKAIYLLNKAQNYSDYKEAIAYYSSPAQNIIFASVQKDIALHVQGRFPLKWETQGKFLLNGANPSHEWQDYIPVAHNPAAVNPEQNYLFSANQYPVDSLYPYYVYDNRYEDFRNRRLQDLLSQVRTASPEDMMKIQQDVFNQKAYLSLPRMLSKLDTLNLAGEPLEYFNLLKSWNYESSTQQAAPAFYEIWWKKFHDLLWDEFDQKGIALNKPEAYNTITFLDDDKFAFADRQNTPARETISNLLQTTFAATIDSVNRWKEINQAELSWGAMKSTSIMHLLRLPEFSIMDAGVGGYRGIVNANSERSGASMRLVMDMGSPVKAWVVYPGGQSGTPGSKYYDNFVPLWADGKYIPVQIKSKDEAQNGLCSQTLNPEP